MANIVLKDINGNETTYSRDKIMVDTAEGGTQIFSEGEAVENVPISLYLANGDQTITAPDGTLVKSAVILKPENLKPENIKENVEIAGVIGTHSGGSISTEELEGFLYYIDKNTGEIVLCAISYNKLYAATGAYNINVPGAIDGFSVVIDLAFE